MKLIEKILDKSNVRAALERVTANNGGAGIDGMRVEELRDYMNANWTTLKQTILERSYKPAPVRRVEIPKPNGGVRKLGIPTVVDRTLQQSIVQVLTPIFEEEFQDNSYGFRPGRSCEQAVLKLLEYLNEGYEWIVDIDLEKFFDNVPQDKLMSYVGRVIHDPDTESLIRKYLKSGVMENGIYESTELGTPQGGNLSPLLSNVMLNELDKELVKRGLRYVRYADDCVITVGSSASANRVMHTVTKWIEQKLGLKSECDQDTRVQTEQIKIPRLWLLQRPANTQMDVKTTRNINGKVQTQVKTPYKTLLEHFNGRPYITAQPRDTRMDKLLLHKQDERQNGRNRCPSTHTTESDNMEAMEDAEQTSMGTAQTRDARRTCETHLLRRQSLSMGSHQDLRGESNIERNPLSQRPG